jgi:hypothetical protein
VCFRFRINFLLCLINVHCLDFICIHFLLHCCIVYYCVLLVLIDVPCYVILVLIGTPLLHFLGACQCILVLLCSLEEIFKYMIKFMIGILVIKEKND